MDFATALNTNLRYNPHCIEFLPYNVKNEQVYRNARNKNIIYVNSAFMYYCLGEENLDSLTSIGIDLRAAIGLRNVSKIDNLLKCYFVYKNYSNASTTIFYPDIIFRFVLSGEEYGFAYKDVGKHENTRLEVVENVRDWVLNKIPEGVMNMTFGNH
jgi:hypothetical protein